jgi:chemotaxis protein histidine kinase CheA
VFFKGCFDPHFPVELSFFELIQQSHLSEYPKFSIKEKILQPFFTTKPTGQGGTGLGLSLAYDIVKAHGGEIKVATKEGEGSEFVVFLPLV